MDGDSAYLIQIARGMGGRILLSTAGTVAFWCSEERYTLQYAGDRIILKQRSGQDAGRQAEMMREWADYRAQSATA